MGRGQQEAGCGPLGLPGDASCWALALRRGWSAAHPAGTGLPSLTALPPGAVRAALAHLKVCKLHLVLFICVSALGRFFCYVVTIVAFYFFNIILYSFQVYSLVV